MRLNLGCGGDIKPGWVNVDIAGGDVRHDLRQGIYPHVASQDSVDYIYTSHFLEHIFDDEALHLLKDCYTVLKPGAVIRICLPDFGKLIKAYVENDTEFFSLLPGDKDSPVSYMEFCAYQYSGQNNDHKALYDLKKIRKMLVAAGFVGVCEKQFDASVDLPNEDRRRYSLYVEARKNKPYPRFMDGSKVLFALTVHDRLPELRLQELLIRNEYGKTVGLHVFCNCEQSEIPKYKNLLEDGFHWVQNTGHAQGSLDHPNMVVDFVDEYDFVVLLAAKTIWTDYALISRVIEDMKKSNKRVAVFNDEGRGHFNDANSYGFYCDFMVFTSELYKKVFPVVYDPTGFPEIIITRKTLELVGGKDGVFYIPCSPGDAVSNFVFRDIYNSNVDAVSIRDLMTKIIKVGERNPFYRELFEKMARV